MLLSNGFMIKVLHQGLRILSLSSFVSMMVRQSAPVSSSGFHLNITYLHIYKKLNNKIIIIIFTRNNDFILYK